MAQELISKALHEVMPSCDDVLRTVGETIRTMSDKGQLLDGLLTLTGKEATEQKRKPVDDAGDAALLVMQAGTNVFGSDQGFLEWLSYPVPALEDKTPLSLLASPAGLQMVIDVLGTIEHRKPSEAPHRTRPWPPRLPHQRGPLRPQVPLPIEHTRLPGEGLPYHPHKGGALPGAPVGAGAEQDGLPEDHRIGEACRRWLLDAVIKTGHVMAVARQLWIDQEKQVKARMLRCRQQRCTIKVQTSLSPNSCVAVPLRLVKIAGYNVERGDIEARDDFGYFPWSTSIQRSASVLPILPRYICVVLRS